MNNLRVSLSTLAAASLLTLAPVAARADAATDGQLAADHAAYRAQQQAIADLNATGRHPLRSHPLAKAQCWLDVSFHEYTRNDRSAFPAEALHESRRITGYLAGGGVAGAEADPARQTPLVNGAARLREDLWARLGALREHRGWACAQQLAACAEVELVHAGNEHNQLGWRHARPYIQIAEDQVGDAARAAELCPVDPPPAPPTPPAPPAPPAPPVPPPVVNERIVLSASVLFGFDRRGIDDLLPGGRAQLDQLAVRLDKVYARIDRLELIGHTDRLGGEAYNRQLSQDRAETIRAYLASRGVAVSMIATGRGSEQPLVECSQKSPAALRACLQPNRRVELDITGVPR